MALALAEAGAKLALVSRDENSERNRRRHHARSAPKRRCSRPMFPTKPRCWRWRKRWPRALAASKSSSTTRASTCASPHRFHAGRMEPHPDHQRHQRVPDVPLLRAADERPGLRAHPQHDLHDEPRLAAGPHRLRDEQGGAARLHQGPRAGTRARENHRQRHQPRPVAPRKSTRRSWRTPS